MPPTNARAPSSASPQNVIFEVQLDRAMTSRLQALCAKGDGQTIFDKTIILPIAAFFATAKFSTLDRKLTFLVPT
jgi:hypothetical protein